MRRRPALCAAWKAALVAAARQVVARGTAVRLLPDSPWIVATANESTGFGMALHDVQVDAYKVLGAPPVIMAAAPAPSELPPGTSVVVAGTPNGSAAMVTMVASGAVPTNCTSGHEVHCVVPVAASASPLGLDTIVVVGPGRGAIFALYELSEAALGVDPYWRFADMEPAFVGDAGVAVHLRTVGSPAFHTRAVFPNDEDLTANIAPSPLGENVWSLEAYDRLYETTLRAKANAMLVGTNPFPDDRAVKLAARRGLTIMHHHYNLLGSQVLRWPLGKDGWNFDNDPQAMAHVWRAAVAAQAGYDDVVWSIGLRGLNDYAYPCPSAASCSRQINDAMSNMTAWVRDAQGPDAPMVLYMWDELLGYLEQGLLQVPEGVRVIFGDEGAGFVHGDKPDLAKYADGLYIHSAMYNGHANQLTEMIGVDRILEQVVQLFMASAKSLWAFVLNVSDLKPAIMTSRAYLSIAYDPSSVAGSGEASPGEAATAYYASFAARYYGLGDDADAAAAAAAAWNSWFAAPLVAGGRSDNWLADAAVSAVAKGVAAAAVAAAPLSGATEKAIAEVQAGCNSSTMDALRAAYTGVAGLNASVPAGRRPFFEAHAVANMAHGWFGCRAALAAAAAGQAYAAGDAAGARGNASLAVEAMASLMAARRRAEQGRWAGWYFGDHLSDFHSARRAAIAMQLALAETPSPGPASDGPIWYAFEDYQKAFAQNYPLLYPSSEFNLGDFVRVHCVAPNMTTGACANRPDGGRWRRGFGAALELMFGPPGGESIPGLRLLYTLDGSEPGASSSVYSSPLSLDAAANATGGLTIRARAELAGELLPIVSDGVWMLW